MEFEMKALDALVKNTSRQRLQFEKALGSLVERQPERPIRHEHVVLHFIIGETDADDRVVQQYETEAVDKDRPILHYRVPALGIGEGVPVEELKTAEAFDLIDGYDKRRRLAPLPIRQAGGRVAALVLFDPEVTKGVSRQWGVSWRSAGLWNPLRENLSQEYDLDLASSPTVKYGKVVLRITFPVTANEPQVYAIGDAIGRPEVDADASGRQVFTLDIQSPVGRPYRLLVQCKRFIKSKVGTYDERMIR